MTPYYSDAALTLYQGDALDVLRHLPDESVQCVVTSPPYWALRDYGISGQIGLEDSPQAYVAALVAVFDEVRRVLRSDGTVWLNLGDTYAGGGHGGGGSYDAERPGWGSIKGGCVVDRFSSGLKPKDLVGIPWRVAFALQDDGWYLRSEITWAKTAPMPESVRDRPTSATEKIFLLSKQSRYFYDAEAARVPSVSTHPSGNGFKRHARLSYRDGNGARGNDQQWQPTPTRNLWNYWLIGPEPLRDAHYAAFPSEIPRLAILAGSREGDVILDPFVGSGTTALVAQRLGRRAIGIDLNPQYLDLAIKRTAQKTLWFQNGATP